MNRFEIRTNYCDVVTLLQSYMYLPNHILFTFGGDFAWEDAHQWFKNVDKVIKYVNEQVTKSPSLFQSMLNKTLDKKLMDTP